MRVPYDADPDINPWRTPVLKRVLIAVAALAIIIQLIPVDRTGEAADRPLQAPDEVMTVLRASCYDCHSAETVWPWYSRIAPVSWLVAHDVKDGREKLDFSRWGPLDARRRNHALSEIAEVVETGEMPMAIYLVMHPDARLDGPALTALRRWTSAPETAPRDHEREHDHDHDH
jgi:hypothetical protein